MIKIFEDDDPKWKIFAHVLEHGITGIADGRISTRDKLEDVKEKARSDRHDHVAAHCPLYLSRQLNRAAMCLARLEGTAVDMARFFQTISDDGSPKAYQNLVG